MAKRKFRPAVAVPDPPPLPKVDIGKALAKDKKVRQAEASAEISTSKKPKFKPIKGVKRRVPGVTYGHGVWKQV